ncbi:MAG TPA: penicillin acylase family protein [Bryobacteraceae bacterium]|jgi:acyl-homoserine lactone acylase PvdQ
MHKSILFLAVVSAMFAQRAPEKPEINGEDIRWLRQAQNVTIIRDDWGIAHVYGKSDADAVFGMIYAQAEDDFNRIETNYLTQLGRMAEAEGESKIYQDLRMKMFVSPELLKKQFLQSPAWLKNLMISWSSGLNYFLARHPEVKPRVIHRFEPWMALAFSEGSIGGDIERINLTRLEEFYGKHPIAANRLREEENAPEPEPSGSNGIAIAPSNTVNKHALLLINPHTSFFFRSELQMASNEGLNAYGAVTWGQLFIYQGFSDKAGWMHTSSGVDAIDEYLETVTKKGAGYVYKFGNEERPVLATEITVPYKNGDSLAEKKFTVYRTQHGPVIREENGKWVSIHLMQENVKALEQSFLRTKSQNYKAYRDTMQLQANSSNNTIYADADGTIAYFQGNFIPKRDTRFDFTKPVDGSDPATEWKGLMSVDEIPQLHNPASGWLYNVNNWPWSSAGASSPKRADFPAYVEMGRFESARGMHAMRLLEHTKDFTLESLMKAAYDSYLPWFAETIPVLVKAWDQAAASDPNKAKLAEQIRVLRAWDYRWGAKSVPTSLAVFWGEEIQRRTRDEARKAVLSSNDYVVKHATPAMLLESLAAGSARLEKDFGTWKTPWGDINRFERLNDDIVQTFTDAGPSIPVPFTSSNWGSLASFGARQYPGTKKWYGTSGNSFVAVVEFVPGHVRAVAVTAGGESGSPASKHFDDEAERYASGSLRDVYYYRDQLKGHTEKEYHPGLNAVTQ